jgi:hypothetical protein
MAEDLLRALLGRGYLPEVLPPNFTSESFGEFSSKNPASFDAFASKPTRLKSIDYSASKAGFRRRTFVVTHPISQFFVSKFISDNWATIEGYYKASPFTVSAPNRSDEGTRAVEVTPFPELHRVMHERLGQYGYVAKSDIQRFYPSIYTHSIPWAFHGKAAAKKDNNPDSTVVTFNKLDQCVRRGQDGQTMGIPIGPDTSRIIGEIVGCALDKHIGESKRQKFLDYIRHVDDIYFGADSREEAEACIATLRAVLRDFGLEINETKTEIYRSSALRDDSWTRTLSRRLENYKKTKEDIFSLFEETFDIADRTKSEAPVRYLLRRADKQKVFDDDHWSVAENFLAKCVYNFPHSMDYVARILIWRDIQFSDLDEKKWIRVINNRLSHNIEMGHDHEICWLLWATISLDFPISDSVADKMVSYSNPLVALMGAHALSRKLISGGVNLDVWESSVRPSQLNEEWWMFAYECSLRGWLKTNISTTSLKDTIFATMKAAGVSFYNEKIPSEYENYFDDEDTAIPAASLGYEDEEVAVDDDDDVPI